MVGATGAARKFTCGQSSGCRTQARTDTHDREVSVNVVSREAQREVLSGGLHAREALVATALLNALAVVALELQLRPAVRNGSCRSSVPQCALIIRLLFTKLRVQHIQE